MKQTTQRKSGAGATTNPSACSSVVLIPAQGTARPVVLGQSQAKVKPDSLSPFMSHCLDDIFVSVSKLTHLFVPYYKLPVHAPKHPIMEGSSWRSGMLA